MEDVRRQMEEEKEDKLRTTAKIMVLKEREYWRNEIQQLLNGKKKSCPSLRDKIDG